MIGLILSLALSQTAPLPIPPGPDLNGRVTGTLEMCGFKQGFRAHPMGLGPDFKPSTRESRGSGVVHGIRYTTLERPQHCAFNASGWSSDGDRMAKAVEAGLAGWSPAFTVTQWREPSASEAGPTVSTTFEQRDTDGLLIGFVRLTEPTDGVHGELSVTYEIVTP